MAAPWTDTWDVLSGVKEMIETHYADYATTSGLSSLLAAPSFSADFTDDPTIDGQHPANQIQVFLDSDGLAKHHASGNVRDDYTTIIVKLTFPFRRDKLGQIKAKYTSTIRQIIEDRWREEVGPLGIYDLRSRTELRYASKRQTGGARRAHFGKRNPTGHQLESAVVAIYFRRRVETNLH